MSSRFGVMFYTDKRKKNSKFKQNYRYSRFKVGSKKIKFLLQEQLLIQTYRREFNEEARKYKYDLNPFLKKLQIQKPARKKKQKFIHTFKTKKQKKSNKSSEQSQQQVQPPKKQKQNFTYNIFSNYQQLPAKKRKLYVQKQQTQSNKTLFSNRKIVKTYTRKAKENAKKELKHLLRKSKKQKIFNNFITSQESFRNKELKVSPRYTKAIIYGKRKKTNVSIVLSCFEFPNRSHNRPVSELPSQRKRLKSSNPMNNQKMKTASGFYSQRDRTFQLQPIFDANTRFKAGSKIVKGQTFYIPQLKQTENLEYTRQKQNTLYTARGNPSQDLLPLRIKKKPLTYRNKRKSPARFPF